MREIGPGTLIAGRYAVSHRIQQHPRWERWAAYDTSVGREVVALTVVGGTPAAAAAVDAARRAAGVADPRLVRVLDVIPGPDDEHPPDVFAIIEEPLIGARTLTKILSLGGLPGDEARRITGEAAMALEAAAARGLRHVVLTPRNVLLLPDGAVRVRGVAVEAALLGLEDTPAAVASRLDARSLVGVGYAALTGRWPLAGADSGLPRAPVVGGAVVAPDELAADVCPDLDRLARDTLIDGAGPITAAEVRAALRPWPSGPTIDLTGDRRGPSILGSSGIDAPANSVGAQGVSVSPGGVGPSAGEAVPDPAGAPPGSVASAGSDAGAGAGLAGAGMAAAPAAPTAPTAPTAAAGSTSTVAASVAASLTKGARRLGSALGSAGTAAAGVAERLGERTRHTVERVSRRGEATGPQTSSGDGGVLSDSQANPPVAGSGDAGSPTVATGWESPLTAEAADPDEPHRTWRRPEMYLEDATLDSVLDDGEASVDTPAPLVPASGPMGQDESRLALALVAGLVVLLAVFGIWGLPRLTVSAPPRPPATTTASASTAKVTTSAGASAAGAGAAASAPASTPSATVAAGGTLVGVPISGAATFDGNAGQVASSSAARAFDGKPDTMWRSGWFSSENFGGLKTPGVGLILDLGQQTQVRQVSVTVPVAQDLTVYVTNRASLEGATAIGTSSGRTGQLVFEVPAGPVAAGQLIIVFVTKLGPDGSGKFRAQVSEVTVSR